MARKGLPKKYAKMGFKKGWREYKKSKRKTTRKRSAPAKRKNTRKRRASKPATKGRRSMGRRGLQLGNKKSVLLFLIGGYNANIHGRIKQVVAGNETVAQALGNTMDNIAANPTATLGPPAVGYWFWGKPWRGKL